MIFRAGENFGRMHFLLDIRSKMTSLWRDSAENKGGVLFSFKLENFAGEKIFHISFRLMSLEGMALEGIS